MTRLLAADAPEWLRRAFLIGGFAGLRTEELLAIRWEHVDLKEGQIYVPPEAAKATGGFRERYVSFTEPLRHEAKAAGWAKLARDRKSERVVDASPAIFYEVRRMVVKAAGFPKWPTNCLRHSFASYHLAECGNASMTALQMGHTSPAMVLQTYAQAVSARATREWWAIRPERKRKPA